MTLKSNENHKNIWSDKEVEDHWDSVASIYVQENNKVKKAHDQRFKETINHLKIDDNSVILNITSRDAEANDYVVRKNSKANIINAEISSGLMKVAKKIRPNINQIKLKTYSSLPFNDNEFNRIICLETLEHVEDPIKFLTELHRISTDNVRMVLSCPPLTSEIPYRIFTALFGGHGEGPHRFLRSKEVKQMFEKTGWKLLIHKGTVLIPLGPGFLQEFGEKIINTFQNSFISELGIRQFFVCEKYK